MALATLPLALGIEGWYEVAVVQISNAMIFMVLINQNLQVQSWLFLCKHSGRLQHILSRRQYHLFYLDPFWHLC